MEIQARGSTSAEGGAGVVLEGKWWTLFGFLSLKDGKVSLENFGMEIPWGGVGSWELRGILKELERPSLSRNPQEYQVFFPRMVKGRHPESRWGIMAASSSRTWGTLGWIRRERPSLGGWVRWAWMERMFLSLGGLFQEIEAADKEGWLLEEPSMISPWRTALGLEFYLDSPSWEASLGGYCTGGPGDPPGGWLRGRLIHRGKWVEASLRGGLSSDRVGTSDSSRLTEAVHYELEAILFPGETIRGELGFSEIHYHPSLLFQPFRAYRGQGTAALLFSPPYWEIKAGMGRELTGDAEGLSALKDWYELSFNRQISRWNLSMKHRLEGQKEDWAYRGNFGARLTGGSWSLGTQGKIEHRGGQWEGGVGGEASLRGKRWRASLDIRWDWPMDEPMEFELALEISWTPLK